MRHALMMAGFSVLFAAAAAAGQEADALANEETGMRTDEARAIELMADFAERTGLSSDAPAERYLWTDAFALMNYLDLFRETGDGRYRALAEALIEQVHGVLGRHRPDDPRTGWLSGLPEEKGEQHPTAGGLRIGKPLPERRPGEPYDERLEWDREGQYFHYLTKWMDALARAARLLDEPRHHVHAVELAEAVFPRFLQTSPAGEAFGLAWKMSVDLSRPQVPGISPHDALDGYVTFRSLGGRDDPARRAALEEETAILRELAADGDWATGDPLGIGGLLLDAFRLALLPDRTPADEALIRDVLAGADAGLSRFVRDGSLELPPSRRLGFRELGLAIGLQTLPAIAVAAERSPSLGEAVGPHLASLRDHADVGRRLVAFWSDPGNRNVSTWRDHADINEVMLATALLGAYTGTARPDPAPAEDGAGSADDLGD